MPPQESEAVRSLNALVDDATALVQQLKGVLAEIQKDSKKTTRRSSGVTSDVNTNDKSAGNALSTAKDAATLIKAHATKLSLLIITEPLTPSAISTVIRELVSGPLTGLATAVDLCSPKLYTKAFQDELLWRSQNVYTGLIDLLQKIPRDGKVLTGKAKESFGGAGRGSLATTGILWSSCDSVMELSSSGLRGFYVDRVGQLKDTLRDVTAELKDWGDEEPDEEEREAVHSDDDGKGSDNSISAQDMIDDFMDSNGTIPRDDPDCIRPRLESSLRHLRLAVILCMAVDKRRMKKLPTGTPTEGVVTRLSEATDELRKLPDDFGDLAAALYDLDPEEIDEAMERCCARALAVGEAFKHDWEGKSDEFTEWMTKFRSELQKP